MSDDGLARQLWPQLQGVAEMKGLRRVQRLEMLVGLSHGVSAEMLMQSLEHAFAGSGFQGAKVSVTVIGAGQEYTQPNSGQRLKASGWELLVVRMEGEG
jgi:Zn finger protein HypA/HybF involved in hydrogenase expression